MKIASFAVAGSLMMLAGTALAQQKDTIAISSVKANESVMTKAKMEGTGLGLARMIESLDGQLIDRVNATRKFTVLGRSDLKDLMREQDLGGSGIVDAKSAAQVGKVAGAKFVLITSIDAYADEKKTARLETLNKTVYSRNVMISAVGKIYDAATSKLLESANFQVSTNLGQSVSTGVEVKADLADELFVLLSRDLAEKIATRVTDVVYPAKVLTKRDKQIMINRGDGTGIAVDQVWNVYAVGEELIDPDTKESLGREEVLVGKVKIVNVTAKTSSGELLEDRGVAPGSVVRLPKQ